MSEQDLQDLMGTGADMTDDIFGDDIITEEEFKKLTAGNRIPVGQYRFKVTGGEVIPPPEEGKAGGYRVKYVVVSAPHETPEGGWPPQSRLFRKYINATEKQKTSERIDMGDLASLIKACGINPPFSLTQAVTEMLIGCEFLATVSHREWQGNTYQDTRNFRPAV